MIPAIICDIDGTVANMSHRKIWEYDKYLDDAPIQEMVDLIHDLQELCYDILFVTARHREHEALTRQWLDRYFMEYTLFMSEDGDHHRAWVRKSETYWREIKDKWDVVYAFDDDENVCRMWRSLGICTLQVTQLKDME